MVETPQGIKAVGIELGPRGRFFSAAVARASEADALNAPIGVSDMRDMRRELGRILVLLNIDELPGLFQAFLEQARLFVLVAFWVRGWGRHGLLASWWKGHLNSVAIASFSSIHGWSFPNADSFLAACRG
jgi:hypothetical protein